MNNNLHTLFFEVTSRCNAFCDHCGSRCTAEQKDELSAEDFKKVLDSVKKHYGTKTIMLNVTGGEPLIRKDLFDITAHADKIGFKWGLVTNGTLITDEVIKKMKKTHMSTITISLDGMEKTHDEFRHIPGGFNKIITAIEKLVKEDFIEHIQVTFIANKNNINELPEVYRLLSMMGINSLRISGVDPIGRAKDNKLISLNKDEYNYLFDFMKKHHGSKLPVVWSCAHYFGDREDIVGRFTCTTGKSVGSVLSNGDIFACPNIPRKKELIQGNVLKDDFCDIWDNKFEFFRNPERTKAKKCESCYHWEKCKGDSLHTFDFETKTPQFCYADIFEKNSKNRKANKNSKKKEDKDTSKIILDDLKRKYGSMEAKIIEPVTPKSDSKKVIFSPTATNELMQYFHFGEKHPSNMYEQQVALIGNKIGDSFLIKFVVPSILYNRARNMATMDEFCIKQVLDEVDIINENINKSDSKYQDEFGKVQFLGFAHSHPQDAAFKFSVHDSKNHQDFVKRFGNFVAVLINPQKEKIVCFTEENAVQATLTLLQ